MTTSSSIEAPRSVAPARLWRHGLIAAGLATAANLLLFAVNRAADVSFLVRLSGSADPTRVTAVHVAFTTLVPFVIGLAVATVAIRRTGHGLRNVGIGGVAVAVVSLVGPLSLEADTGAKVALAAMHLITGVAFIVALRRGRAA